MAQTDFEKAEKLFNDNKFIAAASMYESILSEDANKEKILERIGDCYGQTKNWDQSVIYYRKLKNFKPKNADYVYKYGGVLGMKAKESNRFVALGLIGEVRKSFENAIILNPKHIESRWALIELYLQLPGIIGGSETKATKYANELSKISPVDGHLAKARISDYFDRLKTSEKEYLAAHQVGNSKITFQKLHEFYLKKMKDKIKADKVLAEYNREK